MRMRLIASMVLVFSVTCSLYAQRFHGGLLLGFNASQVDGDTYAGYDKFGLMGGAFVYTHLSEMLDIQMEIKYMGKGARKRTSTDNLTVYKSNLNYIEIPILLKLKTKNKIGVEGGFGFGYLFSYSEEDAYGVLPSKAATQFKPFELCTIVGLNYQLNSKYTVDLRYSYSLFSIVGRPEIANPYFRIGHGVYNNLFSLGILYTLGQ